MAFPVDNDKCDDSRSFTLSLVWNNNPDYSVNFRQQNITIFIDDGNICACMHAHLHMSPFSHSLSLSLSLSLPLFLSTFVAQDCATHVCGACVVVPIVLIFILLMIIIVTVALILKWKYYITKRRYYPQGNGEQLYCMLYRVRINICYHSIFVTNIFQM